MLLAAWMAFGQAGRPDFVIFISALIFSIFLAIPAILHTANPAHPHSGFKSLQEFLSSPVETATETMTGRDVWLQIAIIPVALALAATAIGIVNLLER